METGATASVPRDMGEEKDEPDFIETHCHWVDCDREMGCNDELVKVNTTPSPSLTKSDPADGQCCVCSDRTDMSLAVHPQRCTMQPKWERIHC